jgi:hypothetical protein
MRHAVRTPMAALGRVRGTFAVDSRVSLQWVTAISWLVFARYVQGRRRALALIPAGRPVRSAYGSRVRRYVYLHQDAMWIGLCAAVATGILIRLLSS